MFYRLSVLGISLLLIGSNVLASEIRVNTIGVPGLIDDTETDISLNPAVLGKLKTSRIYIGGSLFKYAYGSDYYRYTEEAKAGYLEYIWPVGHAWMGARYEQSLNINKWNYENYIYQDASEERESDKNFLIQVGFPVSKKISYGIKLSNYLSTVSEKWKEKYSWDIDEYEGISIDKYRAYQIDTGFLYRTSSRNNMGVVISGIFRKWDDANTYNRGIAVTLLPTWALTKRNVLKGIFEYQISRYSNDISFNISGLAWNYNYSPDFLWVFSLVQPWNKNGHLSDDGFFQAGVEKEIIKKLKARTSVKVPISNGIKHIETFAFGLGYKPINRINIDLSFRKLQNHYYDHNQEIGIAGTYYFTSLQ